MPRRLDVEERLPTPEEEQRRRAQARAALAERRVEVAQTGRIPGQQGARLGPHQVPGGTAFHPLARALPMIAPVGAAVAGAGGALRSQAAAIRSAAERARDVAARVFRQPVGGLTSRGVTTSGTAQAAVRPAAGRGGIVSRQPIGNLTTRGVSTSGAGVPRLTGVPTTPLRDRLARQEALNRVGAARESAELAAAKMAEHVPAKQILAEVGAGLRGAPGTRVLFGGGTSGLGKAAVIGAGGLIGGGIGAEVVGRPPFSQPQTGTQQPTSVVDHPLLTGKVPAGAAATSTAGPAAAVPTDETGGAPVPSKVTTGPFGGGQGGGGPAGPGGGGPPGGLVDVAKGPPGAEKPKTPDEFPSDFFENLPDTDPRSPRYKGPGTGKPQVPGTGTEGPQGPGAPSTGEVDLGGAGGLPDLTRDLTNDLTSLQQELANLDPRTSPDVGSVFLSQAQSIIDLINKQEADLRSQSEKEGREIDPATQFSLDQLRQVLDTQLKSVREELNRRGLLDSGIREAAEVELRKGNMTDSARIISERLTRLQNRLAEQLAGFRQQRVGTAQQFGLRAAEAGIEETRSRRKERQGLLAQLAETRLGLRGQVSQEARTSADLRQRLASETAQRKFEAEQATAERGFKTQQKQREFEAERQAQQRDIEAGKFQREGNFDATSTQAVINELINSASAEDAQARLSREMTQLIAMGVDINRVLNAINQYFLTRR